MKYTTNDDFFIKLIKNGRLHVDENGIVLNTETGRIIGQKTPFIMIREGEFSYGIATYKLVWLALKGPIPEGLRVFRKDPRGPCALDNLELMSYSEKSKQLNSAKSLPKNLGEKNSQARFTDEEVLILRREYKIKPFSIRARAKELGTSHPILSGALTGKSYAHVPEAVETLVRFNGIRKGSSRKGVNCRPKSLSPKSIKPRVEKVKAEKPVKVKTVKPKIAVKTVNFDKRTKADRLALLKNLGRKMGI